MSSERSSKAPAKSSVYGSAISVLIDLPVLVAIVLLASVTAGRAGLRRGLELMPWPDGLEYAAAAVNLAKGRGAVLHFGGYTYPSRYTGGYPLILEFAYRIYGGKYPLFYGATFGIGMLSVVGIYILARWVFGRVAAIIAALLLALSPVFITYSTLVMSDVPTLFMTICAALMLVFATSELATRSPSWIRLVAWLAFGFLAGFSTIIRPTNVTLLVGLALCVVMVPLEKRELSSLIKAAIAVAVGFAIPVAWQLHQNSINLGSAFASGYSWWAPEVYGAGGKTFSAAYLFGPTLPRNPYGNLMVYVTTLLGLYGMVGNPGNSHYVLYPFAGGVFAIIGFVDILRGARNPTARRLTWFGLGYLATLTTVYCFYIFTDVAFILPGAFVLFIAAGQGIWVNLDMWNLLRSRSRSVPDLVTIFGVIALDVLLVVSLSSEAVTRMNAWPRGSDMVGDLESLDSSLPRDATVVSNISLQFLDLYLGEERRFVGLNSLDPGERFTDYHLHRLYEKRAAGWDGPVPAVVFEGEQMSAAAADSLASAVDAKRPVFLILAAPESQQYADVLKTELDQLQVKFAVEPVSQNEAVAVYRVTARK